MHPESPDDALNLAFASADAELFEPDAESWLGGSEEFLEEPAWGELGIPGDADGTADALPTEAWNLGSGPLRRVVAAATLLPMLLGADLAVAAPPVGEVVEQPTQAPPVDPPPEAAPAPAPTAAPTTTAAPAVAPGPMVITGNDASAVWAALIDRRVVFSMNNGKTFRGTVLGLAKGVLICARESDGLMVFVDPVEITAVHVDERPQVVVTKGAPEKNGQGMIVMGSIATAIGGILTVSMIGVGANCLSYDTYSGYYGSYGGPSFCPWITIPLGVVGAVNLGVGIPLIVGGMRRRKAHQASKNKPVIESAFVKPGSDGVTAGFGLRF